ncbi:uncharacterized protein MONBRDRAFT_36996 [Monosiga brevicollis MX1]|uniref:Short-chain dehydrogenase/reductase SDR n=1 Tax=Monosiga brevicollis TaxID=81824 RepID=A9UYX3_MONBE|nr:uncharacterized protein MONBRDRAFT_36996 [Monosiga brevicollis MX1]EDQ89535.1 predicted protein [Monosiga brevicollis MX1]|eukprot:XP_001745564.1 hypothetical protein [Monosiga brevicollis MX1]
MSALARFQGLATLVTGGGAGIGAAIAQRLASEGARVCVVDLHADTAAATAKALQAAGVEAVSAQVDMSQPDGPAAAVHECVQAFGQLDVLVNNAAGFHFESLANSTDADWERLFRLNVMGYSNAIKAAQPHLEATQGSVVNLASVSSFVAQPDMFIYNATKGAIAQLTRCLAWDFAPKQVRVNAVAPGAIFTPASVRHMERLGMTIEEGKKDFSSASPMNRMGQPEEVASAVAFLASKDASFITGEIIVIDGGATLD